MTAAEVGKRIRNLRTEKGLTQKELADALGVTDKAVSKWENGRNFPDIAYLESLAEALGCDIRELLGTDSDVAEWEKYDEPKNRWIAVIWILAPLAMLFFPWIPLRIHQNLVGFIAGAYFVLMGVWFGAVVREIRKAVIPILLVSGITVIADTIIFFAVRAADFVLGPAGNYATTVPFRLYGGLMIEPFLVATRSWFMQNMNEWADGWAQVWICAVFGVLLMLGLFFAGFVMVRMLKRRVKK